MKTNLLRSILCGTILAAVPMGINVMADDTASDAPSDGTTGDGTAPHHHHHHHCHKKDQDGTANSSSTDSDNDSGK